ncbi:MAG: hypothetical protein NC401_06465 [Ruminococcus sp.]|nr:hypothetical protein [Ruminococcus sp.]
MTIEELKELEAIREYCKEEAERKAKRDSEWEAFLKEADTALNDPKRKRWYDMGNGHTLMIQAADRGLEDDFAIEFYEDCKLLDKKYATAEVISDLYDIAV